jgi:hypothetical protein
MEDKKNQREDMDSKVDKLFKEKLEAHTLQPSTQAWEKVESHLSKKNKMVVWLRIAAAIALLGLLTFAALNWSVNKTPKVELVKEEIKPAPKETTPVIEDQKKKAEEDKQVAKAPVKKKANVVTAVITNETEPQQETQQEKQQVAVIEALPPANKNETTVKAEKTITLVYSLPAIKKQAPEAPVVAEARKTGLERVLEIAKEVKNADNPLGELREAKDDILAFEFKKDRDKTKKNN